MQVPGLTLRVSAVRGTDRERDASRLEHASRGAPRAWRLAQHAPKPTARGKRLPKRAPARARARKTWIRTKTSAVYFR